MPSAAPPPSLPSNSSNTAEEEEDDYLTMSFTDPLETPKNSHKSITTLHKSRQRHAETHGRPKSKAALLAEEERRRAEGLSRRVGEGEEGKTNKGLAMMRKLGWKEGNALGATDANKVGVNGRLDPLTVEIKDGREGIGLESERKRKVRETFEREREEGKRRKVEEGEYRERVAKEREEKRTEGQCFGAMRVLEGLDDEEESRGEDGGDGDGVRRPQKRGTRPLHTIPVLYRSLVKSRRLVERDTSMRHTLQQSLPTRLPTYDGLEEDPNDKLALGKKSTLEEVDDAELDAEDEELAAFEALDPQERLRRLVVELREKWTYCFWCKYRYRDKGEMEMGEGGCPGEREEDHD